jgi:hypothetical protein
MVVIARCGTALTDLGIAEGVAGFTGAMRKPGALPVGVCVHGTFITPDDDTGTIDAVCVGLMKALLASAVTTRSC